MEGIMRCPNCENENRDQAKFCDECGFPLTGAIARAAIESLPDEQDEVLVETEEAVEELSIASDDAELSIEDTQRIDVASDDFEKTHFYLVFLLIFITFVPELRKTG